MRIFLLMVLMILAASAIFKPAWAKDEIMRAKWLQDRITEAKSIGHGSSLLSLLRLFTPDAGDHPVPYQYNLKSCQLIRVEVELGYFGAVAPDRPNEDYKGPNIINRSLPLYLAYPTRPRTFSEEEKRLLPLMEDANSIKVGMSRADLLTKFAPDAGLQPMLPTRYVHKKCNLVKIDVTFDTAGKTKIVKRPIDSDADLPIKTVSRPYVDSAVCD